MPISDDISSWLTNNLSDLLSFPIPGDIVEYILSIENERDLDDFLKTLLDFNNPRHKDFLHKFKILRLPDTSDTYDTKNAKHDEGGKRNKKGKSKPLTVTTQNTVETAEPEDVKVEGRQKKKNKFVNLFSPEGQQKDTVFLKGRHKCECQASKHRLINNCLKCGRIVCAQEGSGPCFYCGTLVCSTEEQNILKGDNQLSRKLYDALMDSEKNGGFSGISENSEDLDKALEQRNRLLEFDRNTARRNTVIDDESDYFTSTSSWITKEESDKLQKKEEEEYAKRHTSRLDKKFTLDFAGRCVIEEDGEEEHSENYMREAMDKIDMTLAESHANPDIPLIQPRFIDTQIGTEHLTLESSSGSTNGFNYKIQDKEYLFMSDQGACLSIHQPWASLLVRGIKKHEGRTWYTSHRGRLWIAAAAKVPSDQIIRECESFYKNYTGDENLKFPSYYPTSCLLGCVSLVDCLPQEEYFSQYPDGECDSPFVFVCEGHQELNIRFPITGSDKIYKLDKKIHEAARKSLLRMAKEAGAVKSKDED